jgi:hypothetical protein
LRHLLQGPQAAFRHRDGNYGRQPNPEKQSAAQDESKLGGELFVA